MGGTGPKAVILGIDGGSLCTIDALIADGELPTLSGLFRRSLHGTTTTTWPAHTAPGWSTFVTARRPGGHGVYQFFDTQDPDYGDRLTGTADFGCSTIWEWIAVQGLSAGIINVPMSHPPRDLPGYQITWPLERTLRFDRPRGLLAELAKSGAPFAPDIMTMFQGDHNYLDLALANVEARSRSIRHLLEKRPVDVVMAVLTEVDRVSHHYLHFGDACHPHHTEPEQPEWADAVRLTYRAVDQAFGEILDQVDEDTTVMLVSDHGIGEGRYNVGLNDLLAEAGLLRTRPGAGQAAGWFDLPGRTVDFSRTAAYMPTPGSYAVNVNLRGRQRMGIVDAADVGRVLDEVSHLCLALRAPDTGERVFEAALPRADAFPGPMMHAAPDLLLIPRDEGVLADPGMGEGIWKPSWQTGMHRYAGVFAIASPRISPGRRETSTALADLAPSLLYDLGLAAPGDIHGHVIPEVRRGRSREIATLTDPELKTAPDRGPSLREEDATAQSLRAMGYL